MSGDAAIYLKSSSAARQHRALSTRPHFKVLHTIVMVCGVMWVFFGFAALANFGMSNSSMGVTVSLWAGIVLPLVLLAVGHFVLRPIAYTVVVLEPEKLTIKRFDQDFAIPFAEIEAVRFSYIPYSGGWMKIVTKSGKEYALTAALERSEYILDSVVNFNAKLVEPEAASRYRRTAIYYDHSWARMLANLSNGRRFIIKYGLSVLSFPVAFFVLRHNIHHDPDPSIYQMIWAFLFEAAFALVLGAVIWLTAEVFVLAPHSRRQLVRNPERVIRPVEFERTVAFWSDVIFFLVQCAVMALLM